MTKRIKWLGIFVLAALIASFLAQQVFKKDEYRQVLEEQIQADEKIVSTVGKVNDIAVVKRVVYFGTETDRPYRQYTCNVRGSIGKASLIIRLYPEVNADEKRYEIVELKKI